MRGFVRLLSVSVTAATVLGGMAAPGSAADVEATRLDDGRSLVTISGRLTWGDADKLQAKLRELRGTGRPAVTVQLDSTGGFLPEAMAMADVVRRERVATAVESTCASACFIVFAAGRAKLARPGARLGVHMPLALNGPSEEWAAIQAARYKSYGVPDSVVAKMENTPPSSMAWLNAVEQTAMGVRALHM